MGATAAVHPADPILQAYGLGKLDDGSSASVSKHLEGCDSCQRRVAELSSDDFLGRLQQAQVKPDKATSGWSPSAASSMDGAERPVVASPPVDTLPPELVDHPDYEIVRELGRGGMGVVYLAHNRLMGRDEVLKVMSRHIIERPGLLARFLGEIRAVARLQHPNIVTAYSAFRLGESILFAMEYVDGLDLARMVKAKGPLPVGHACYFVSQAAQGMQHAHEQGMVHRDIKPGNLMLAQKGQRAVVKVLDFGLAKATREIPVDGGLTNPGQALGTPDYMAPEQIRDAQKADIRADIYSLGCTLYYLLSGGPPFHAQNLWDLYQAHHSMDAKLLNFVRPEVPSELAALVAKMMAKEPGRRFQTPAQVAQALTPFFKKVNLGTQVQGAEVSQMGQPTTQTPRARIASASTQPASNLVPAAAPPVKTPRKPDSAGPTWESLIEFKETEPLREPALRAVAKPKQQKPAWLWAAAAGALLLGFLALWAGIVLTVKTPEGTLVLENVPENAIVEVDGERKVVLTIAEGKTVEVQLKPGQHGVVIKRDGVVITGESVTIESGKDFKLVVRREEEVASHATPSTTNAAPEPAVQSSPPIVDSTKFNILSGTWRLNGVELIQTDSSRWYNELMFGDDRWTDYDFWVDAMRVEGDNSFSLFFRGTGLDNRFDYTVAGDGNKTCQVQACDQGRTTTLKKYDYSLRDGAWYTARVQVRGNHLVGSIYDGYNSTETRVFDIYDDRHPRGRVGLQTFGASFRFKNIKVTDPDGRVLWEGLPAVESTEPTELPQSAGDPERSVAAEGGWISLFNGKDLTGWEIDSGPRDSWRVADGELVVEGPGNYRKLGFILTERAYAEFILRFEFQPSPGTNSGVAFWAQPGETYQGLPHHPQIELFDAHTPNIKNGSFIWSTSTGVREILPPYRAAALKAEGLWNTMEVEVRGGLLRVEINSQELFRSDLAKLAKLPGAHPDLSRRSGRIGLQSNAGTVHFRHIEIKELSPTPPDPSTNPASRGAKSARAKSAANTPNERRAGSRHPADAKEFRGKFYKVFSQQLSWHHARLKCRELGGHLAVVRSEEENRFLTSQMKIQGVTVVWLGATDEDAEGHWVWVDGEPLHYSNWNPTQPNNKQGREHYMIMISGNTAAMNRGAQDGKWHDQPNDSVQFSPGFICQWD